MNKDLIEKIRKQTHKYFVENSEKNSRNSIILEQYKIYERELANEYDIIDYYSAMTECLINIIEDLEEEKMNNEK